MSAGDQADSSNVPAPAGCEARELPAPAFTTSPTPTTVGCAPVPQALPDNALVSRRRKRPAQLPERIGLTYAEVDAVLGVPERSLRRLVSTGRVRRSVLRVGTRAVRFLRDVLVEELREESR